MFSQLMRPCELFMLAWPVVCTLSGPGRQMLWRELARTRRGALGQGQLITDFIARGTEFQ